MIPGANAPQCPVIGDIAGCSAIAGAMVNCVPPTMLPTFMMFPLVSPTIIPRGGVAVVNISVPSPFPKYAYNITVMEVAGSPARPTGGYSKVIRAVSAMEAATLRSFSWTIPADLPWPDKHFASTSPNVDSNGGMIVKADGVRKLAFYATVEDDPAIMIPVGDASNVFDVLMYPANLDIAVTGPAPDAFVEEGKPFRVTISASQGWPDASKVSIVAVPDEQIPERRVPIKLLAVSATDRDGIVLKQRVMAPQMTVTGDYIIPMGALAGSTVATGRRFFIYAQGESSDLKWFKSAGVTVNVLPPATPAVSFTSFPATNDQNLVFGGRVSFGWEVLNGVCWANSTGATRVIVSMGQFNGSLGPLVNEVNLHPGDSMLACSDVTKAKGNMMSFYLPKPQMVLEATPFVFRIRLGGPSSDPSNVGHLLKDYYIRPAANGLSKKIEILAGSAGFRNFVSGTAKEIQWRVIGPFPACAETIVSFFLSVSHAWGVEHLPLTSNRIRELPLCTVAPEVATTFNGSATLTVPAFLPYQVTSNARLTMALTTGGSLPEIISGVALSRPAGVNTSFIEPPQPMISITMPAKNAAVPTGNPITVTLALSDMGFDCAPTTSVASMLPTYFSRSRVEFELRVPMVDPKTGMMMWMKRPLMAMNADNDGASPLAAVSDANGNCLLTQQFRVDMPAVNATDDISGAMIVVQVTSGMGVGAMASAMITLTRNETYVAPPVVPDAPSPFQITGFAITTLPEGGTPGVPFNSSHTLMWNVPLNSFECRWGSSTTHSMANLEIVTNEGMTYVIRSGVALCHKGFEATTWLDNVLFVVPGLMPTSQAKLVLRVVSGVGKGAMAWMFVALVPPQNARSMIRVLQPMPISTFGMGMLPPVLTIRPNVPFKVRWAFAGNSKCGPDGTQVMVALKLPMISATANNNTGVVRRELTYSWYPLNQDADGMPMPVPACPAGATEMMGELTATLSLSALRNVTNAELVVAIVNPNGQPRDYLTIVSTILSKAVDPSIATVFPVTITEFQLPPPPEPPMPALTVMEPKANSSVFVRDDMPAMLPVKWTVDPTKVDCASTSDPTPRNTTRTGRSYVQVFFIRADDSIGTPMLLDTRFLPACSPSTNMGSVNVTIPAIMRSGQGSVVVAVTSGVGSGNSLFESVLGYVQPFAIQRITSGGSGSGSDDGSGNMAVFTINEPKPQSTVFTTRPTLVSWTINVPSLVDCASSRVAVFLGTAETQSLAQATMLPFRYPACTAAMRDGNAVNVTIPASYFPLGATALAVAVVEGKGMNANLNMSVGGATTGPFTLKPFGVSSIMVVDSSLPKGPNGWPLLTASALDKPSFVAIAWMASALDCASPIGNPSRSMVRIDLMVPRPRTMLNSDLMYDRRTLRASVPACFDLVGNGRAEAVLPADLPSVMGASIEITVVSGYGAADSIVGKTPAYITLAGLRGIKLVSPLPGTRVRIPMRSVAPVSDSASAQKMIMWSTGFLTCMVQGVNDFDIVSVMAFRDLHFNASLSLDVLASRAIWSYKKSPAGADIPACAANKTIGVFGVDVPDLPADLFNVDANYVMTVAVIGGPNAGLMSDPVSFTVVKPFIAQIRPGSMMPLAIPTGSPYSIEWLAAGLDSDEMCGVYMRKDKALANTAVALAMVKCMDRRAAFLLVNPMTKTPIAVDNGYVFDVVLLGDGGSWSATVKNSSVPVFNVTEGAKIVPNSLMVRAPLTSDPSQPTGNALTTVTVGSRVHISWQLSNVPERSPFTLLACNTQAVLMGPDGKAAMCIPIASGMTPLSWTLYTLPFGAVVTGGYSIKLQVRLLAANTTLSADSASFSVDPPAEADARFSIVDPVVATSSAVSQRFNITWRAAGLPETAKFHVDLFRITANGSLALVSVLTGSVPTSVKANSGCDLDYTCMGQYTVMGLDAINGLLPAGAAKDAFRVCMRHETIAALRDFCTAPITIFREVQPMLWSRLMVPSMDPTMALATAPIFRSGGLVAVEYQTQAVNSIVFTLMSSNRTFMPIASDPIMTSSKPTGVYSWSIPAAFPDYPPGTLFWFSVRAFDASNNPVMVFSESAPFAIVRADGALVVRSPMAGSMYDLRKPLFIAWSAVGVTKNLTIRVAEAASGTDVFTIAANVRPMNMNVTWAATAVTAENIRLPAAESMGRYIIKIVGSSDDKLIAASDVFVIQRPPMRLESVMLMPSMGVVRLNDFISVTWRHAGLPFGATATLALIPNTTEVTSLATLDRSGAVLVSTAVPLTTSTMWGFKISGKFDDSKAYRALLVVNDADGIFATSAAPGFKVALPQNGFNLFFNLPSSTEGGAFVVGASTPAMFFNWVTTVGGAMSSDTMDAVNITLENKLMPGWSRAMYSGLPATSEVPRTSPFVLPTNLDLSPGVASAYYVKAENYRLSPKMASVSPVFTIVPPRAVITVMSPTSANTYNPASSTASEKTISVSFSVTGLAGATSTEGPLVNVSILNAFIRGPVMTSSGPLMTMIRMEPSATDLTVTFVLDNTFKPPIGGEKSFFAVVRSVMFPSIGGSSAPFTVVSALAPPKLTIIRLTSAVTNSDSSVLTAVFKDTDTPTGQFMVSNPGSTNKVSIFLMNARSPALRRVVQSDIGVGDFNSFGTNTGVFADLPESSDPTKKDLFFYAFISSTDARLNTNSSFFTISSSTVAIIRLLSPAGPMSRIAGEDIFVSWASIGLPDTATVSIDLVNDVLADRVSVNLKSGLPLNGGQTVTIPDTAVANPFYFIRVTASSASTLFAQSPVIAVTEKVSVSIAVNTPTSAVVALTGQPLDISWRPFAADAYTVTVTLVNELINGQDMILTVAERLPSTTTKLSWMVPSTLRTSLDVRRSYALKFTLYSIQDNTAYAKTWISQQFTIATREAFVSAVSPAAGDVYTLGDTVKIAWAARNVRNSKYRIGLVNDGLKALWTISEGVETTNFDLATGSSSGMFSWQIPTTLPVTPSASSLWYVVITPLDLPTAVVRAGQFTIRSLGSPYVVLAPGKDAVVTPGSQVRVVFTMSSDAAASEGASKVNIALCNRMSTAEIVLASGVSSTTSSIVIPSDVPTGSAVRASYFIRVSPAASGTGFTAAESDIFTVSAQSNVIRLTSPSVGASFTQGDRIAVTWQASAALKGSTVRIEIANTRTLARANLGFAAAGSDIDSAWIGGGGRFAVPASMPIPVNKTDAAAFIIRVVSTSDESVADISPRFALSLPSQTIRVFKTMSGNVPNNPAPMAGDNVTVYWAAMGFSTESKVSVFLRNLDGAADDSSLKAVGTNLVGRNESCAAWGFMATTAADSGGASWLCGMLVVPVTDMEAMALDSNNRSVSWSIVVRSADDAMVGGQSRAFNVRPKVEMLSLNWNKPAASSVQFAGAPIAIEWTQGTGSGMVELYCVSPFGGEILMTTISKQMQLNQAVSPFILPLSQMNGEVRYDRCFVRVSTLSGTIQSSKSPDFSIAVPATGVTLVKPARMMSTVSAISLTAGQSGLSTFLSGQGMAISWAFITNADAGVTMASYTRVEATLRRVNLAEGTNEEVFKFWPRADAKLGADGMSLLEDSTKLPDTLPFGLYSVQISALANGMKIVVDRSAPFFVRPSDPMITIVEPQENAFLDAGGLLKIAYASKGIAASNRVMLTLTQVDGNRKMHLITNSSEASGIFQWAIPVNIVDVATRFTVRVSLLENATIRADSAAFTIRPKARYISVDWPAPSADGVLPIWKAEDQVTIKFSASGFTGVSAVTVELWQDRFFVAGSGDRKLATLASSVPLMATGAMMTGSLTLPVPSDIDSTAMVYVVVRPVSTNPNITMISGRSKPFPIRSAPVPGLTDFLGKLCDNLWTDINAVTRPPWIAASPALKAFCAKSCSECTAPEVDGAWMPAVTLDLDFEMSWIGGQRELRLFKNLLGAFRGDGSNICWPRSLMVNSTAGSGTGTYSLAFSNIAHYNTMVKTGSAAKINMTMPRLTASQVSKPLMSCTSVQPMAKSTFSIAGLDPSSLDAAKLEDLIKKIKQDIIAKLQANGIVAVEADITVNLDMAAGTGTASRSLAVNGRRLQSTTTNTGGSVSINTPSNGDANTVAGSLGGGSSTVAGMTTNEGNTVSSEQQENTGTSGGTSSGNSVTTTDGSSSKAGSADNALDQLMSAFQAGGFLELLARVAAQRDIGASAIAGGGAGGASPTPGPTAPSDNSSSSSNAGAIVGGVIGALLVLGLLGVLGVWVYNNNQAKKRSSNGFNGHDGGAGTGLNPLGKVNNGARASKVSADDNGVIPMVNNPLKNNNLSVPSNNRMHYTPSSSGV